MVRDRRPRLRSAIAATAGIDSHDLDKILHNPALGVSIEPILEPLTEVEQK